MNLKNDLFQNVRRIQELLIDRATGKISARNSDANDEYSELRKSLISTPLVKSSFLPIDLVQCFNLDSFWDTRLIKFISYRDRRNFIYETFSELLAELETETSSPSDELITGNLEKFDVESVHRIWTKALERRISDPDGALTISRSLLEVVCKRILEEFGETYSDKSDLPSLYRQVSSKLNLSPNNQTEQIFKQILGNCQSIVENLSAIRNRHGDAHGITKKNYKPSSRHAELAVNLSGAMATFLVSTWKENFSESAK